MHIRKKICVSIGLVMAAAAAVGAVFFLKGRQEAVVMWVGDLPVQEAEFWDAMKDEYANTCGYFARNYGAEMDGEFWEKEYDGTTPLDYTKEIVTERLTEEKLIQIIGKEMDIDVTADYKNRIKNWKEENQNRSAMAAENKPVYGPINLDWRQYRTNEREELVQKILEKMYEQRAFTSEEINAYYEAHKDSYFKNPCDYKIEYVTMPAFGEGGEEEERAIEIMNAFLADAENEEFQMLGKRYEELYAADGFTYENEALGEDSMTRANMLFPAVLQELGSMNQNEMSGVIKERNAYYIVRCIQKTEETYESRQDAEETIKRLLVEEAYQELLSDKKECVEVQMNEKVYEALRISA